MASGLPKGWEADVLKGIGAPDTKANERFLDAWQTKEGGATANTADWNPLNTTLYEPDAHPINSVGVEAYPDWQTGLHATVQTLKGYPTITKDLRTNYPVGIVSTPAGWADLNKWVSGQPSPTHSPYVSSLQTLFLGNENLQTGAGALGNASDAIAQGTNTVVSDIWAGLTFPQRVFKFVTSWRFAEIVGGSLLLLVGLYLLGRQFGVNVPLPMVPGSQPLADKTAAKVAPIELGSEASPPDPLEAAFKEGQIQGARRAGRNSIDPGKIAQRDWDRGATSYPGPGARRGARRS